MGDRCFRCKPPIFSDKYCQHTRKQSSYLSLMFIAVHYPLLWTRQCYCSNSLRMSATGLKFGETMHSNMKQITIKNGYAWPIFHISWSSLKHWPDHLCWNMLSYSGLPTRLHCPHSRLPRESHMSEHPLFSPVVSKRLCNQMQSAWDVAAVRLLTF